MTISGKRVVGICILSIGWFTLSSSSAGEADVTGVMVECYSRCDFHVTLQHADEGWEHYANRWDVGTPQGKVIGTRVLYHPHVHEQPFTRSLSNVEIPPGTTEVIIRANDSVHKQGGKEIRVKIPSR